MKKNLSIFLFFILLFSCTSIKERNFSTEKTLSFSRKEINLLKDFKIENMDNKILLYSKNIIKDKKITLLIIATEWCPYCRNELIDIEKFYSEFKDKIDVILIYSNDRTTKEKVKLYDSSSNFSFKRYFDKNNEAYVHFGVKKYPSNYIIQKGTFLKLDNPVTYEKLVELFQK